MAEALEYLAAAVLDRMRHASSAELNSLQVLKDLLRTTYDVDLNDLQAEMTARRLEQLGFLRRISDQYAGTYFVPAGSINILLKISDLEKNENNSQLVKALAGGPRLFQRAFKNDDFWDDLNEDLEEIPSHSDEPEDHLPVENVPASDRIVTLSHNQQIELEVSSTELIDGLAKENSIDGDASLRERFLGQLRAGRELIRAQTFRVYLLYESILTVLNSLIERYQGQAIGQVAKKLLDLLIEHVIGK
jgi:hypothetical protein